MHLTLRKSKIAKQSTLEITGSKSETNRLLLLRALHPHLELKNISNADDSHIMARALEEMSDTIDVGHAGTAMRFLTAFFALREGRNVTITGSERMKARPIKILVDALKDLGAEIVYLEKQGYPPLEIKGKRLTKKHILLNAGVSSQYISALLLIASNLKDGLDITLEGCITSVPYIKMTLALLDKMGIETTFKEQTITVAPSCRPLKPTTLFVESDWSSASYYFSIVALSDVGTQITLSSYYKTSLQGDAALVQIYRHFGVVAHFKDNAMTLTKKHSTLRPLVLNLQDTPDIAQTIVVTCFALGISCHLTGLHTLKIKETDRLVALKNEIEKLGGAVAITDRSIQLFSSNAINKFVTIATYNDHRMAMAFAPLALKVPIIIQDAGVVSKSYPSFWQDLRYIGIKSTW